MSNVRPLHLVQQPVIVGELLPTLQATDQTTGQLFAWHPHPQLRTRIQVFDSMAHFMSGTPSDLAWPFPERLINPVSGIPAWHHYVDAIRKFQQHPQ